jgi:hypothetical protein
VTGPGVVARHARRLMALLLVGPALGCAAAASPVVTLATPAPPPAIAFPDDPAPVPRFHSLRHALFLPLPDGKAWRIDDHSRPELVATHAPTQSIVKVGVFRTDGLVGRNECEAFARDRKLVPPGELHTLESAVETTQDNYDTRVWVAVEPGSAPGSPLVGHVMAFGGFLRKCYVFDFATRVDSADDETVLSDRLAFARARILGGLQLEVLGAVPRQPSQTAVSPAAASAGGAPGQPPP